MGKPNPAGEIGRPKGGPPLVLLPSLLPPLLPVDPDLPHRDTTHFRIPVSPATQPHTGHVLVKAWLPMRLGEVLKRRRRNSSNRQLETDLIIRLHLRS